MSAPKHNIEMNGSGNVLLNNNNNKIVIGAKLLWCKRNKILQFGESWDSMVTVASHHTTMLMITFL